MATPALGDLLFSRFSQIKSWTLKRLFAVQDFDNIKPVKRMRRNTSRANFLKMQQRKRSEKVLEFIHDHLNWHNLWVAVRYILVVLVTIIMTIWFQHYFFFLSLPKHADGWAAPGLERVLNVFKNQIHSGADYGGAFAVYHKGALVVDAWGGYADKTSILLWNDNTVSKWFSVTKAVSAICAAVLVDRGMLNYSAKVSDYWPEFAQNGKENITVTLLLSHQGGLAVIEEPFDLVPLMKDPEKLAELLERQAPNWEPGTKHGYHAATFGLYVDQLVRRTDPHKRNIQQFFKEEIAIPFGIDFHIGLPRHLQHRAARLDSSNIIRSIPTLPWKYFRIFADFILHPSSLARRVMIEPSDLYMPPLERNNQPERREMPFASAHGYGTARAVAKLMGILANGGTDGSKRLLSSTTIQNLTEPVITGHDEIILDESIFSHGMKLYRRFESTSKERYIAGHPGIGGQMGMFDKEQQLSWAYITNYLSIYSDGDYPIYRNLEKVLYECIQTIESRGVQPIRSAEEL